MISQHIFKSGFNLTDAQNLRIWANENLFSGLNSTYEVDVTIPTYTGAANQKIISNDTDWLDINSATYTEFFVDPAAYTGIKELTLDGSSGAERYIVLNDGSETHPSQLTEANQARVQLKINADYWIIDRISCYGTRTWKVWELSPGASNNVFNRLHFNDVGQIAIYTGAGCNDNVFQNSAFYESSTTETASDVIAINFNGSNTNCIVVNNEMRNFGDAFQTTGSNIIYTCEGLKLDSNIMWIDDSIYCDVDGTLNTNGIYSYAENAIDLKVGSQNPANPMIITNNICWGYRYTYASSGIRDFGSAFTIHYQVENTEIKNNLIFDSAGGISISDKGTMAYAMKDSIIDGNDFWDCGSLTGGSTRSCYIYESISIDFTNNNIIAGRIGSIRTTSPYTIVTGNTFIDAQAADIGGTGSYCSGNSQYNSGTLAGCTSTTTLPSDPTVMVYVPYDFYSGTIKYKSVRVVVGSTIHTKYG